MSQTILKVTNNKKPIAFSDVDGTIYKNFNLKQETIDDIHFAVDNGLDFNICTGNPVQERMLKLAETLKARYLIGSSGAQIFDMQSKKYIACWKIDFDTTKLILDIAKKNDFQVLLWDNNNYYYTKDNQKSVEYICSYHFISKELLHSIPKLYKGEFIEPTKIEIYSADGTETEESALQMFEKFKSITNLAMIPTNCNIEISPSNISKGSAVLWMLENVYNNVETSKDEIMTIGDGNNDIPMLSISKYSYAMANATQTVHGHSHFHTSAVEQNGLGEAILDYIYRLKNITKKYMLHEFENNRGVEND